MTGAWPHQHGCFCIPTSELNRAARPELPLLTQLLANAGYRIAWTGKYHGELETYPDSSIGVEELNTSWEYKQWREAQGIPKPNDAGGFFGTVDSECPSDKSALAWQADQVIRQIEERAANEEDEENAPFFIRWDPPEPHLPCDPTEPFAKRFSGMDIAPWESFQDDQSNKPSAQKRQKKIWESKAGLGSSGCRPCKSITQSLRKWITISGVCLTN